MKKTFVLSVAVVLLIMAFAGCSGKTYKALEDYDMDIYTDYYWDNNEKVIYHESCLPISSENGEDELELRLLYNVDKVISVQNFNTTVSYTEGTDYVVRDGKIYITKDSAIKRYGYNEYYFSSESELKKVHSIGGYHMKNGLWSPLYTDGEIQSKMVLVSYTYNDTWTGPVPAAKGSKLPKTISKLKNGENVTIVCYGDSIAYGADSSYFYEKTFGKGHTVPYYFQMAMDKLAAIYPKAKINAVKTAVGGTGVQWGVSNCKTEVIDYNPDLVILAFGMNDGNFTGETYKAKIGLLIEKIRESLPDVEIIVVSTMMPNVEIADMARMHHAEHAEQFLKFENEYTGLAVMNMTEIHQYMLTKKLFIDMTGNNINHPNDFLARAYAQVLLKTLEE